jgi:hypothetical protein
MRKCAKRAAKALAVTTLASGVWFLFVYLMVGAFLGSLEVD